jgi:hypothetical protein
MLNFKKIAAVPEVVKSFLPVFLLSSVLVEALVAKVYTQDWFAGRIERQKCGMPFGALEDIADGR